MHGILLLNKPQNITSHEVIQKIKKKFQLEKIGHCGTLDPTASGILIVCIGNQTKLTEKIQNRKKRYLAYAISGLESTTHDTYGKIKFFDTQNVNINTSTFKNYIQVIKNTTNQAPPLFSSIKHNGIQFYKYARLEINIKPKNRPTNIIKINLTTHIEKIIILDITCSKGTYVREIIHNLGKYLNYPLCVYHIIRLSIDKYNILNSYSLKSVLNLKTKYELEKILI